MKIMGYVNKFNRGIAKVKKEMEANCNPQPVFDVNKRTEFRVTLLPATHKTGGDSGEMLSPSGDSGEINGESPSQSGEINGEITGKSGEIKVYQAIAEHPGIKREALLLATGIPLRTIDRIVKRLSSGDSRKIEYRGSKRTGGWFVRT